MKTDNTSTVRLREADRHALAAHFLALETEDRRLRFGSTLGDDAVRAYVERIDLARDGLFVVHDDNLEIVAAVHVAPCGEAAELGLSVLTGWRGQGVGDALFRRAVNYLRNRGTHEVFVHCLAENGAMMHLARKSGMRLVYCGSESDARLALEPATMDSFVNEWLDDQKGHTMQAVRRNARLAGTFWGLLAFRR